MLRPLPKWAHSECRRLGSDAKRLLHTIFGVTGPSAKPGGGNMEKKRCPSIEDHAVYLRPLRKREEMKIHGHTKPLAVEKEKLATRLKPLMAGLDSADPLTEHCPVCHQALLPEIGRCNIFHREVDYRLVKSRFLQGPQLRRRGWSIPASQGGYRAGILRFLGAPIAYLPRDYNPDRFNIRDCIPLYSKTDVEEVEQTLEFRAFVENACKVGKKRIAKEAAATALRKAE
jgi:hypothetical protein